MFKPSILRPASSPLRRLVLRKRFHTIRADKSAKVQRVRFIRPILTWRRLATTALYTTAIGAYFHYLFPAIDDIEDVEEEDDDEDDEDENEEGHDDDSIFIPLGWAKPMPRMFYKGSDPEWQEFRKLASDPKRHKDIQLQLVSIIRTHMANDPRLHRRMGQINVQKGKWWLDIIFPDGPPQEYERGGLEISEDGIGWTKRPVTQQNYFRLQRVLWPSAAFSSIYATSRYIFNLQIYKIKNYLGIAPQPDPQIQQLKQRLEAMHRQAAELKSKGAGGVPGVPTTSERNAASATPAKIEKGAQSGSTTSGEKKVGLPQLPSIPQNHVPIAFSIFAHTLARNWKPLDIEAPRGTVIVTGLVEVHGTRARCTMDVTAAFDPKINQYVVLRAALRRVQDRRQAPKGG